MIVPSSSVAARSTRQYSTTTSTSGCAGGTGEDRVVVQPHAVLRVSVGALRGLQQPTRALARS